MDIEQVRLQYQRLDRHYQEALTKDSISFLDAIILLLPVRID